MGALSQSKVKKSLFIQLLCAYYHESVGGGDKIPGRKDKKKRKGRKIWPLCSVSSPRIFSGNRLKCFCWYVDLFSDERVRGKRERPIGSTHSFPFEEKRNFEEALQCHTPAAAGSLYSLNFLSFTVSEIFFLLPPSLGQPIYASSEMRVNDLGPSKRPTRGFFWKLFRDRLAREIRRDE